MPVAGAVEGKPGTHWMNLIKSAAVMPPWLRAIGRNSLTGRMLALMVLGGLMVWLGLDLVYRDKVDELVVREVLYDVRLQAAKDRIRLGRALQAFARTARIYAAYPPLQRQVPGWLEGVAPSRAREQVWKPAWLQGLRSVDGEIPVSYALVMGPGNEILAVFRNHSGEVPAFVRQADFPLTHAGLAHGRILSFDGQSWLVTAQPIPSSQGVLVLMARFDSRLLESVLAAQPAYVISAVLSVPDGQLIADTGGLAGAGLPRLSELPDHLELVSSEVLGGEGTMAPLRFAVWLDHRQIEAVGQRFLWQDRRQRAQMLVGMMAFFGFLLWSIRRRLAKVYQALAGYSEQLGIQLADDRCGGDQIDRLRARVRKLGEEMLAETYALEYQARHDPLTNLPNRALLMEKLNEKLAALDGGEDRLALMIMDLDRFKEVNDTLGHHIGDRLLQEVGRRLVSVLRRTDTVARLGGDEFAVLLPGGDLQRSRAVCRKVLSVMDKPIKIDNFRLRAGISIGVALAPSHGQDANLLLRRADVAMYQAKRKHAGFAVYKADHDTNSISRLGLSSELRDAIEADQLSLEYQPMVDIRSGRIFCVEALVRWRHPQLGMVPPEEFVPIAEQTGVIRPLTLWVIDRALAQLDAWHRAGIELRISLNLSVRSLQDRQLPSQIQKLVDHHGADPGRIILEITESAIMSDPLTARRVMRRLSNTGFQLSIDDFGTGYSSLAYLKQLPVDEIKIDKSFVTQMDQDENDAVIVRATIDLAHNLGLKVVAEGVENTDVWDLLEMLGCDCAQGYFIRKPLAPQDLARWIRSKEWQDERWVTPLEVVNGA